MVVGLVPSLSGLSLRPAPRPVPIGADDEDRAALHRTIFGEDDSDNDEPMPPAPAPAPAPPEVVVLSSDEDMPPAPAPAPAPTAPAPGAAGPSNWLGQMSEARQAEIKRKAEDAVAAANEAKRLKTEAKQAERQAAKEAKEAGKAAEKAAAAQAKAEAKAEAARLKEAEKAEAARLKEAEKAEAARLKEAEKAEAARLKELERETKELEKQAAKELKLAAAEKEAAEKQAAKEAKEAAAAEAAAEKEAARKEKEAADAADQAEADRLGITVKSLRDKRRRLLNAAQAAGYATVAEYEEAMKKAEDDAKAAAAEVERAKAEAEAAAKAAEEAEAARKEKEEACEELEEQIHRLRWQQRSMAEDYDQMLQEWEDNGCDEPKPAWMDELKAIFDRLSKAIEDAEKADPTKWQLDDGYGGEGEHQAFVQKFEQEKEDEGGEEGEGSEEGEGMDVRGEASRALGEEAQGMEVDEEYDAADATLDVDIRVVVQNTKDVSETMEVWRVQVIHTDAENMSSAARNYKRVPDPTGKPGATKLVRQEQDKVPYRPDIPEEYIASIHAEPKAIEAAVKRLASGIINGGLPQSTLDSVAAAPMTAFDATNTTTQLNLTLPNGKGMKQTQYAVSMQLPANDEENRTKAGALIEGLVSASVEAWSANTGLKVVLVSGVQDKDSYIKGVKRMEQLKRDAPPNEEEKRFLAAKFGPDWHERRPDDVVDALLQFRTWMRNMDQEEAIEAMTAKERGVTTEDGDRVRREDGQ